MTSELRADAWRAVKAVGQGHADFLRALTTSLLCGRQMLDAFGWPRRFRIILPMRWKR